MDYRRFGDERGIPEPARRRRVEKMLRLPPSKLKNLITEFSLQRIADMFTQESFAVVSACNPEASKRENFERQYRLFSEIRRQRLYVFCHIGFWSEMPKHCLFIPRIERARVWEMADVYELKAYIWGDRGRWHCFNADDDTIAAKGSTLQIIAPDEEFVMYSRITGKKAQLQTQLAGIQKKHMSMDEKMRMTVDGLKRRIADLEQIESEILG